MLATTIHKYKQRNKTWALLQTTEDKDELNIASLMKS